MLLLVTRISEKSMWLYNQFVTLKAMYYQPPYTLTIETLATKALLNSETLQEFMANSGFQYDEASELWSEYVENTK